MLAAFGSRILLLLCFSCVVCIQQYGTPGNTLYVAKDVEYKQRRPVIINRFSDSSRYSLDSSSNSLERRKRDASSSSSPQSDIKNISTWTTHLNDSHQQLMVHWVGEGSNVIICLARDSSPRNNGGVSASSLYISYDYGKNFTNKTELFKLGDNPNSEYAQLDKFFNHPKYPEFCVFLDATNKKLYYTSDNGRNIYRSDLSFHPSELAFDEDFPNKFVVLDKVDPNRKLYLTLNGGRTFKQIYTFVKTFAWSSGTDFAKAFYVERGKPNGTSTVLVASDPSNLEDARVIFEDSKDFQIKGDYMFATKQAKERNTVDLYISHQRSTFYKAEFQTELDLRKFHIADVTDKRIFVSVMHTESLSNLYVSEINNGFTQYNMVLSLDQIMCYFPDGNWKDSRLEDVTEDPFTDLYRVEGLRGIYIASRVESKAPMSNIGPEYLTSLISYDHGASWAPIKPPTEDENRKLLHCHIENSCSLHLCQKFSQLYPFTRSASIMSSKSAPGIIMATGVMGKSLKGIPGVYLSRDAGLTWKRILKDYYFFNYGDHGGVLVAVKYFKSRGETREILYSTNEGIEWNSYQFNEDDLRIYGLMTEPGENTTTFTMFGSAHQQHQWIIITLDLRNAFSRNCTSDDYKFWSPSPSNTSISCVLGSRDTFQRRQAHTNCYNGINYDRPVKKEICECSRWDFECDFGFMPSGEGCIRNQTIKYDPYAIPSLCRPGHFYKRTKGYRKIDGDVCTTSYYLSYLPDMIPCPIEEPTEFILVALRDKIARIDLSDNSTVYPVKDQRNIVAIEFDMKNNCIYWADIELDKINRQCFNNGTTQEVVVDTDLASIEGMALDWISNVLFFVDGLRKKIEAVRTDLTSEGRMRATILDARVLSKPRGIAVHPKAGYLFWTDWDRANPSVSRSNLDGSEVTKLFKKPLVQWPNGITIDQMSERIYWVDAMVDYIASADLNGRYFKRILMNDERVAHPFAVAVVKDKMYWDDWKTKSIFIADKDTGTNIKTLNDSFNGLMDLKVFAHFIQHGSNMCSYKNTSCNTLCLGGPRNTFSCLCPDGFTKVNGKCICENGLEPLPNMTCPKKAGAGCDDDQFSCKNGLCISMSWRCDGNNDCGDMSDEARCPVCAPPMLVCDDDTRCYLPHWRCDGDVDCADFSDERDCTTKKVNCTESQFKCKNGQCIDKKWMCDGDADCSDGSDERDCIINIRRKNMTNCSANAYECANASLCIPKSWVCDGETDCPGGDDESPANCKNSTCAPYMFRCPMDKCIFKTWVCDGVNDCGDLEASDERNCPTNGSSKLLPTPSLEVPMNFPSNYSCLEWMFVCGNGNCVPFWWRCDAVNDCGDNSDEANCGPPKGRVWPEPRTPDVTMQVCSKNQFTCATTALCIPLPWVCDGMPDCGDSSDERECGPRGRGPSGSSAPQCSRDDETPCADGRGCVLDDHICDGVKQCADGSDETGCPTDTTQRSVISCPSDFTLCDDGMTCISPLKICNGYQDCYDGSDEQSCNATNSTAGPSYQFLSIGVDQTSINSTSFLISCWMPQQKLVQYSFLPSISVVGEGKWKNMTWTNDSVYRFTNLQPFTNYNVTFYVKDSKSNKTYPSLKFVNTTTRQGVPSPPERLTVRQMIGDRVNVVWDPPKQPNGIIRNYTLYRRPPYLPMMDIVAAPSNNNSVSTTLSGYFQPNVVYRFWVTASNDAYTSNSSEVAVLTFDDVNDVDDLVNVSMTRVNETSVFLKWHKIRGVDGYKVQVNVPSDYFRWDPLCTTNDNITLTNLPPGVQLYIDVVAHKNSVEGDPFTIPVKTDGKPDAVLYLTVQLVNDTNRNAVNVSWSAPSDERYKNKELEYEVHYTLMNNYRKIHGKENTTVVYTKNTSIITEDLKSCEGYVFLAGLRGGRVSNYVDIVTRDDPKGAVKDLRITMQDSILRVKWSSSCFHVDQPIAYRVDILEETHNKTSKYALTPTKNETCEHVITDVHLWGRYKICVYRDVPDAVQTCEAARAAGSAPGAAGGAGAGPLRGVAAWRSGAHLTVTWREAAEKHKYQIIVSPKVIPDDLIKPTDDMTVVTADFSPAFVTYSSQADPVYVGVRMLNEDGYYSNISQVQALDIEGTEMEMRSSSAGGSSALWWGCGAALVGGVVLAAALLHVLLKHRRLARSFLHFTQHTPRYDSRRGQATIGEHDFDDVPPIQGFSDDEPLVIA